MLPDFYMSNLSKNEIVTLEHLSDRKDHSEAPLNLTDAQFCTALKSLHEKKMVLAAFVSGGGVYSSKILKAGLAALDDLADEKKRILYDLLREYDLILDQFELLKHAVSNGKCENIFNIPNNDYDEQIAIVLFKKKYVKSKFENGKDRIFIPTISGEQLVKEIELRLYSMLTGNANSVNVTGGGVSAFQNAPEYYFPYIKEGQNKKDITMELRKQIPNFKNSIDLMNWLGRLQNSGKIELKKNGSLIKDSMLIKELFVLGLNPEISGLKVFSDNYHKVLGKK